MSILLYHSVHPMVQDEFCQITPAALRDQLQFLQDCGATFVPLSTYLRELLADCLPPGCLSLTFDDGYEDFAEYALPVLEALRLSATQFICPAHAGSDNRWNFRTSFRARHMTASTLRTLIAHEIEVEPHGWTHRNFLQIDTRELEDSLRLCLDYFRDELNLKADYLAYPYGSVRPDQAISVAKFFRAALAVDPVPHVDTNYSLTRIAMVQKMDRGDLEKIWQKESRTIQEVHDGRGWFPGAF